jgi:hypothetical protein
MTSVWLVNKARLIIPMKVDGNRFRQARFATFLDLADRVAAPGKPLRILDVGGTQSYWEALGDLWAGRDWEITLVNLGGETRDDGPYRHRPGNACAMPEYADNSFDLVHSNSVIEHVGQWPQMADMAREVRRLAPHYYLQTPNLWFPVEPHYRTLFFALYPEARRARMLMTKRRGFRGPYSDFGAAIADVQTVNLLDARGLTTLFPDGKLVRERFFGLTKSLTVIR